MTGNQFLHALLTPIDPKNIFFMLQSGYAADFILGLTVESINGVRNRSVAVDAVREADPEFIRALELMGDVQAAGAVGMRVVVDKTKGSTTVVFFRHDDVPADIAEKSAELRRLLKLSAEQDKFSIVNSPDRGAPDEIAVNSRSMLQIIGAFAAYVDVPEADLLSHSAPPVLENIPAENRRQIVRIHSGKDKPAAAFVAVRYRDHWSWVDDGDWQTKRALAAIMFFFTLEETSGNDKLPVVTIPAQ